MFPIRAATTAFALYSLLVLGAVSAAIGAFMAIALGGGGFPVALLDGTPFRSTFWPGVILGMVVGGTQCGAAVLLARRAAPALLASSVAGFAMVIWIFTEVAMLEGFHWLQALYLAVGLVEIVLVLALLGVRPSVVDPEPAASRTIA